MRASYRAHLRSFFNIIACSSLQNDSLSLQTIPVRTVIYRLFLCRFPLKYLLITVKEFNTLESIAK